MAGFFGVVGYSIYNYHKKSSTTSTSVYVIQTRVAAQGFVICLLTAGLGYNVYQKMKTNYASHHSIFPKEDS
jgi:hypothetical protein